MSVAANTISVALCTHNGARFIERQVASILAQTMPPRQIVLSDDASSDGTVVLVRDTVAAYRRDHPECATTLHVVQNGTPLGVTANFEQAILACSAELIALCDQDDVWSPDRLAVAAAHFARRPRLLLLNSDARLIDDADAVLPFSLFESLEVSDATTRAIHAGQAFEVLMKRNIVTGATTVIRRGLAAAAAPFPDSWVHDEWLAIIAAAVGELDVSLERLIDYRQHGSNQIGVRKLSTVGKFRRLMEPGAVRNRRLLARANALVERFDAMRDTVPEGRRAAAERKRAHERVRSALSRHRIGRIIPVVRELRTGRYSEFGRGASDAVRDLLQPL